jgi:hypothetical protein
MPFTALRIVPSAMVSPPRLLHSSARRPTDQLWSSSQVRMTSRLSLGMALIADLVERDEMRCIRATGGF